MAIRSGKARLLIWAVGGLAVAFGAAAASSRLEDAARAASTGTLVAAGQAAEPPRRGEMKDFNLSPHRAPAPEVHFTDAQGRPADLSAFKGKVTLVNIWATWCPPCVKEMPSLQALQKEMGGNDFAVATISEDHNGRKAVDAFFERTGIDALPANTDPDNHAIHALHLGGIPTTLLLDRDGREIGRIEGDADWDGRDAHALIDWAIHESGTAGNGRSDGGLPEMQKTELPRTESQTAEAD